jgi:hypothetical protein
MTKKKEKSLFNLSLSTVRRKKRLDSYFAFTQQKEEEAEYAYSYFRGLLKSNVRIGCECGCGGDSVNESLYFLGASIYRTLND